MKNSKRGFTKNIFLIIIVVVLFIGGFYVLSKKTESSVGDSQPVTPLATLSSKTLNATSTGSPKLGTLKKPGKHKSTYPFSKYLPLSNAKLQDLKKTFIKRNGSNWSVELDNFGFIKQIKTSDPKFVPQDASTEYILTDTEKTSWEKFISKNADFFGIDNPSGFKFEYVSFGQEKRLAAIQHFNNSLSFNNGATSGIFLSENEEGIEVFKFVRAIQKFEVSISIQHHFWPNAKLPLTTQISKHTVEQKFIGNDYTFQETDPGHPCDPLPDGTGCGGSNGPSTTSHTVKIQSGDLDIKVVPYFYNNSGVGELRLIYLTKLLLPDGWTKFIDAITGEELNSGHNL